MKNTENRQYLIFLMWCMSIAFLVICALKGCGNGAFVSQIMVCALFGLYILYPINDKKIIFQKFLIGVLVCIYHIGLIYSRKIYEGILGINIVCCFLTFSSMIFFVILNRKKIKLNLKTRFNGIVFITIVSFILLSIETIDSWMMWDARVYYSFPYATNDIVGTLQKFAPDFSGIQSMFLGKHTALGYSMWVLLFQLFAKGIQSVQIADITLACLSIFSYYKILQKFLNGRLSNIAIGISTIPFAFSPFILGIVGNINLDTATMYFGIILIACSMYNLKYLQFIFAVLLCFTKETAIIYYVVYVLIKIIFDYLQANKFNLLKLIHHALTNINNYIAAIPVFLWLLIYFINPNGGWSNGENTGALWNNNGMHCFGINGSVITMKLQQIFIMNFNWIFWLLIVFALVVIKVRKKKMQKCLCQLAPIISIIFSVLIFGCLYITVTHTRYIVPIIPAIYLLTTILLSNVKKELFLTIHVMLAILLLIQSFVCIDPIMKRNFKSMSAGDSQIYSTYLYNNFHFSDCVIYNRHFQYWSTALENTLIEAGYQSDMLIVLPDSESCTRYCLFGDHETLWNNKTRNMEYYNEKEKKPDDCELMRITNLSDLNTQMNYNKQLMIIPAWGDVTVDYFSEKTIIKEGITKYKGYTIQYYLLE